ncbi:MAG: universal stress protein [Burkholderiales bacterium]|nr:universal stress protein [Burkholderiales bacterium]
MYKHILLAYDGSELSDKALNEGIALAKDAGAKITLIYVVTPHHLLIGGGRPVPGLKRLESQYAEDIRQDAKQMLDNACQRAVAAGRTAEVLIEDGTHPYENIVEAAKRLKADVIVMSTHGRGNIAGLMVGSQTLKVLTHSSVPVLVVR